MVTMTTAEWVEALAMQRVQAAYDALEAHRQPADEPLAADAAARQAALLTGMDVWDVLAARERIDGQPGGRHWIPQFPPVEGWRPPEARARHPSPEQFDLARHWRRLAAPHLDGPMVQALLRHGSNLLSIREGRRLHPRGGRMESAGRAGDRGRSWSSQQLSWYQPQGRSRWIAPFVWGLATRMFPDGDWRVLDGRWHSVVTNADRSVVFDILMFRSMTARESLLFAGDDPVDAADRRSAVWKVLEALEPGLAAT